MHEEIDILEDYIYKLSPDLLNTLLKDHTTSTENCRHNIFWATSDYELYGKGYEFSSPITPELITGENGHVIMPRILKALNTQRDRSRDMAEVFTPSWICNAQNNLIDEAWFGRKDVFNHENENHTWTASTDKITFPHGKTWQNYVREVRMEITCGEAPYLVSRYDTTNGKPIPLENRIGLLDRKLRVVSENTKTSGKWLKGAQMAYKSVYGYEWQGDNLLIARENLLMTFLDYYRAKFGKEPELRSLLYIAYIISWNLWQMDGLKGVVPGSCKKETTGFFGMTTGNGCPGCSHNDIYSHNGIYCLIRDWGAKAPKDKIKYIDLLKR